MSMSFIVEARRRQQQETVPTEAASLAYDRVRQRERRIWLVVGVLTATGFMLTAAIIIKWFMAAAAISPADAEMTLSATEDVIEQATTPVISSVENVGSDTSWYQPVEHAEPLGNATPVPTDDPVKASANATPSNDAIIATGSPAADATAAPRSPSALRDAPDDAQQTLLAFRYSSHLYTSTPARRSLSVNGRRMREGEAIGHWTLAEITEQGAIWDNGDIMVDVPVLDLWQ